MRHGASPLPYETDASAADQATLLEQLGRPVRGVATIARRCVCGRPAVVRTLPRLPGGPPFPTSFYLTLPAAVTIASRYEAGGVMVEFNVRLAEEPAFAAKYAHAHIDYLDRRAQLGHVPEIDGISAGGMPTRVKCLHALLGHALAVGPGVNPVGDELLERVADEWTIEHCRCV